MLLRPSASHAWLHCAAQPQMVAAVPESPETDASREGTCAAWVAEKTLKGEVSRCADLIGQSHDNGWLVEVDMARHIQEYVDLIRSYRGQIYVEQRVELNQYIAGTPDCFVVTEAGRIIIYDLKYGYDIVEPERNPQVSIYAAAVAQYFGDFDKITIGIYQPRPYHPLGKNRVWNTTRNELTLFVNQIIDASIRAQDPTAKATAGSWCQYCPAAATCAANAAGNYAVYEALGRQGQRHMSPQEIADELDFLEKAEKMLSARKDAVRAEAEMKQIPGWHMRREPAKRRFKIGRETIKMMTGIDPVEEKMITPAELERRGVDPDLVNTFSEKPMTKPRLARIPKGYYAQMFGETQNEALVRQTR